MVVHKNALGYDKYKHFNMDGVGRMQGSSLAPLLEVVVGVEVAASSLSFLQQMAVIVDSGLHIL